MARSRLTDASEDLIKDSGSILLSVIQGEQIHLELTLSWLVNLSGYQFIAKVQEAINDGEGTVSPDVKPGGITDTLPVLNPLTTDNIVTLVVPKTLSKNWSVQPKPDRPVYGFIELSVEDTGIGNEQQIWKPFRGLIEVRYSPTEAT
jgi:hypothetical protein